MKFIQGIVPLAIIYITIVACKMLYDMSDTWLGLAAMVAMLIALLNLGRRYL